MKKGRREGPSSAPPPRPVAKPSPRPVSSISCVGFSCSGLSRGSVGAAGGDEGRRRTAPRSPCPASTLTLPGAGGHGHPQGIGAARAVGPSRGLSRESCARHCQPHPPGPLVAPVSEYGRNASFRWSRRQVRRVSAACEARLRSVEHATVQASCHSSSAKIAGVGPRRQSPLKCPT